MDLQTYLYSINKVNNKKCKKMQLLLSLILSLFIIFTSVKLALMFKPLYYFDIQHLNIVKQSGFSKDEIVKNYDYVISYLLNSKDKEFKLPSIPYSKYGQIHFKDVKRIFTSIDILLIITGILSVFGLFYNLKERYFSFLKYTSSILILLPTFLLTTFMINFDATFTVFHKIFFRNDYWQFDPDIDPIIKILPEEFFYHSALLIVILIIFSTITLRLLYKKCILKYKV